MSERKPSVRDVAEQRHEQRCTRSHQGSWHPRCVRAADAEVLRIARDETWWHVGEHMPDPITWQVSS